MGDDPRLSAWIQCNYKGPYRSEAGGPESGDRQSLEWGQDGPSSQECGWPLEARKAKTWISPCRPQKEHSPASGLHGELLARDHRRIPLL